MKLFLLICLVFAGVGCAAFGTIHQQCSDPGIASGYRNYEQCYAERTEQQRQWARAAEAERQRQANERQTSSYQYQAPVQTIPVIQNQTTHCTPDLLGGFNCNNY